MILIVAKFPVQSEHAEAWTSLVAEFTEATRAEPGNLFFDWFRSVDEPDVYLLVEAFRDGTAGQEHVNSAHFKRAMAQLPAWLAGTPEIVNVEVAADGWSRMAELEVT